MSAVATRHRFTTTDYQCMAQSGILRHDARIELLNGDIVDMSAIGPRHSFITKTILGCWLRRLPEGWHLGIQDPVTLDEYSEPQPDITLVRGVPSNYAGIHPGPGDIGLLIEVAETSLEFDTGEKRRLYAAKGIPEYWVVDIPNQRIEVSTGPGPQGYASTTVLLPGQTAVSTLVEGLSLGVADLFPAV